LLLLSVVWSVLMALLKVMNPTPERLATLSFETLGLRFKASSLAGDEVGISGESKVFMTDPNKAQPFVNPSLLPELTRFEISGFSSFELTACTSNSEECAVKTSDVHAMSVGASGDAPLDTRRFSPLTPAGNAPCNSPFHLSLSPTVFQLRSEAKEDDKCAGTLELSLGPGKKQLRLHPSSKDAPSEPDGLLQLSAAWRSKAVLSARLRTVASKEPLYRGLRYDSLEGSLAAPFASSPERFKTCQAEAGRHVRIGQPGVLHRVWKDETSGALSARIDSATPVNVCSRDLTDCEAACRFPSPDFWHEFWTWLTGAVGLLLALGWLAPSASCTEASHEKEQAE
jgi:hypothetical protein